VTLPDPSAKASDHFGVILGVRELSDGRVLIDDGGRRQIRLFDPALGTFVVVMDSAAGTSRSYGARPTPLIRYLDDSTLVPDYRSRTLSVLDSQGQVVRSWAMPTASDLGLLRRGAAVDRAREFEIGVRVAVGATPRQVVSLVARQGMIIVIMGALVGVVVALAGRTILDTVIYGASSGDPLAFAGAVLAVALVGAVALLIPARRAARANPSDVLRTG
jgi:hypothetical protein